MRPLSFWYRIQAVMLNANGKMLNARYQTLDIEFCILNARTKVLKMLATASYHCESSPANGHSRSKCSLPAARHYCVVCVGSERRPHDEASQPSIAGKYIPTYVVVQIQVCCQPNDRIGNMPREGPCPLPAQGHRLPFPEDLLERSVGCRCVCLCVWWARAAVSVAAEQSLHRSKSSYNTTIRDDDYTSIRSDSLAYLV